MLVSLRSEVKGVGIQRTTCDWDLPWCLDESKASAPLPCGFRCEGRALFAAIVDVMCLWWTGVVMKEDLMGERSVRR